MNTFAAFRSIAVELLYPNLRYNPQQVLPRPWSGPLDTSRIAHRYFHLSQSRRGWVKNSQPQEIRETEEQRKARERKKKEIGLRNREIPYKLVQVGTPQGLGQPRTMQDVLKEVESLNALASDNDSGGKQRILKRYYAQLVSNDPSPIVKILDSKEEFRKKRQAREKTRNNAVHAIRKEVQLTWASSRADVETKLEKMKEDLKKGFKVDLAITPKKDVRPPRREMGQRADELAAHFLEIAKEWKGRDYTKTAVVIYFQGNVSLAEAAVDQGVKKPKKLLLKEQKRQIQEERLRKKQDLEARSRDNEHELSLS